MLEKLRQFEPGRAIATEHYERVIEENDRASLESGGYIYRCSSGIWLTEKALAALGVIPAPIPRTVPELKPLPVPVAVGRGRKSKK